MVSVLSEHIEYLTLSGRYEFFQKAIEDILAPGDVVADLGCGVGVLGLQCLKAGAAKVYGIDSSDAIHLARETVLRAGLSDRYHCISGSTFDTELPEKVDLLICDHVGYFGFDYGIADMMRDAATRMLKAGGRIVPDRLSLFVAGVSSQEHMDIASAWLQPAVPTEFRWLDEYARNTKFASRFDAKDLCTGGERLGQIDLNALSEDLFSFSSELTATGDGRFCGIAGWFAAHLGGDVWMTNSPLDDASIGRPQAFLPVKQPFDVKTGDVIKIKLRAASDGKLIVWIVEPPAERGARQQMSTWGSMVLSEGDLSERTGRSARLTQNAQAANHILSLVDGERSFEEIERIALEQFPDIKPTRQATLDFVRQVLARNTMP